MKRFNFRFKFKSASANVKGDGTCSAPTREEAISNATAGIAKDFKCEVASVKITSMTEVKKG